MSSIFCASISVGIQKCGKIFFCYLLLSASTSSWMIFQVHESTSELYKWDFLPRLDATHGIYDANSFLSLTTVAMSEHIPREGSLWILNAVVLAKSLFRLKARSVLSASSAFRNINDSYLSNINLIKSWKRLKFEWKFIEWDGFFVGLPVGFLFH